MLYSRVYLTGLPKGATPNAEIQRVVQQLADIMNQGGRLSLAEESFLSTAISSSVDDKGNRANMHDYPALYSDLFHHLYPRYVRNRDGYFPAHDGYGQVPPARRQQDIAFLNAEYEKWRIAIANPQQPTAIRQHLANEARRQLLDIETFAAHAGLGSRVKQATIKEIVMHSKYVLYFVEEYYQELKAAEQTVPFASGKIVVDSYAYIHILFRHYAEHIKLYQLGKSYHFDQQFDFTDLPNILVKIIACYFRSLPSMGLRDDRLFVRLRGTLYVLWFRRMTRALPGNVTETYHRLQTFYPVVGRQDLAYAASLLEVIADDGTGLLYRT